MRWKQALYFSFPFRKSFSQSLKTVCHEISGALKAAFNAFIILFACFSFCKFFLYPVLNPVSLVFRVEEYAS